jgi:hypothetical protein
MASADNRNQQDLLQARASLAGTTGERRAIELKLLDLQFEEERIRLRAVIAESERLNAIVDATEAEKDAARTAQAAADIARKRLGVLPELQQSATEGVTRQNEGPMAAYRRRLSDEAADINTSLERLAVDNIERLEDSFGKATAKALGLKGAIGELIAELAVLALRQAILAAMGGPSGGSGGAGGGGGGILTAVASLFGGARAAGGPVDRGKFYLVGEKGPELFAPGAAGSIVPQGKAIRPVSGPAQSAASRPAVHNAYHISVSADNSVTPAGFAKNLARDILQEAAKMDVQSVNAVPGRVSSFGKLGS